MRPGRVMNGTLSTISLYSHDYFHLEGIGHATKASRELGSAPIYDSYSPTYNPSHGPQEGERNAPRTLVTLHLSNHRQVARENPCTKSRVNGSKF